MKINIEISIGELFNFINNFHRLPDADFRFRNNGGAEKNRYKNNGNGTVTDSSTGLMWQQSGSNTASSYYKTQDYIDSLNKSKFSGHTDWRLPTLDELKTLLEPEKQSDGWYIDPIFDKKQRWCWSSDLRSGGGAWLVDFYYGNVHRYVDDNYVRAVRHG